MAMHSFGTFIGFFVSNALRTVGEVRSINGPSKSITAANASHLRVTNALHSFVPGLKDGGEVTMTINMTGAGVPLGSNPVPAQGNQQNYRVLFSLWNTRTESLWRLTFPDTNFEQFWAFITNLGPAVPEDDVNTVEMTLKCSGDEGVNKRAGQIHSYTP